MDAVPGKQCCTEFTNTWDASETAPLLKTTSFIQNKWRSAIFKLRKVCTTTISLSPSPHPYTSGWKVRDPVAEENPVIPRVTSL
jgi:hypothetical protein